MENNDAFKNQRDPTKWKTVPNINKPEKGGTKASSHSENPCAQQIACA